MQLWDAFLDDYGNEIHDWTPRQLLEIFWHFCQDGNKSVAEFLKKTVSESGVEADAESRCGQYRYL